jgi:D-glycero-D-manno-heptose 1,7-bisphosphate phosphatase
MAAALFLDRDGVLNERASEGRYVSHPADFRMLPGVPDAIATVRRQVPGVKVVVVTNQRGIARGVTSQDAVDEIHRQLSVMLAAAGGAVDRIEVCPHDLGSCDCRKPALGMFRRALDAFPDVDPATSALVGDSASDMQAGRALGARTYLVGEPDRRATERAAAATSGAAPDGEADSLPDLVRQGELVAWLLGGVQ